MLIKFLKNIPVSYDQIHTTYEEAGTEKEIRDDLAISIIKAGSAKEVKALPENKVVKEYDNKMIDNYETKEVKAQPVKRRGRPAKKY